MSNYESDPAGLGVGKRYGPLFVGGVVGTFQGEGSEREVIYEIAGNEVLPLTIGLPEGYLISEILYEVSDAFATGAEVDVTIDGGAPTTADIELDAETALVSVALTGLANQSSVDRAVLEFTPNAAALASVDGEARVLVRYRSI